MTIIFHADKLDDAVFSATDEAALKLYYEVMNNHYQNSDKPGFEWTDNDTGNIIDTPTHQVVIEELSRYRGGDKDFDTLMISKCRITITERS